MPKPTQPFKLTPQSALEMVDNACSNYEGTRNDHATLQACMNLLKSCVQTCAVPEVQAALKLRQEKLKAEAEEEAAKSGSKSEEEEAAEDADSEDSDGDGDADQEAEPEAAASGGEGSGEGAKSENGQAATAG